MGPSIDPSQILLRMAKELLRSIWMPSETPYLYRKPSSVPSYWPTSQWRSGTPFGITGASHVPMGLTPQSSQPVVNPLAPAAMKYNPPRLRELVSSRTTPPYCADSFISFFHRPSLFNRRHALTDTIVENHLSSACSYLLLTPRTHAFYEHVPSHDLTYSKPVHSNDPYLRCIIVIFPDYLYGFSIVKHLRSNRS